MAKIQQSIEMQRGFWQGSGSADTFVEIPQVAVRIDTSVFDGTVQYFFEAAIYNNGSAGQTTTVELYNHTDAVSVSGSTLTTQLNSGYTDRQRSPEITLSGDKVYTIRLKHSNTPLNAYLYSARIIVIQSGTITKTQIQQEIGAETTVSSTSNTNRSTIFGWFLYESSKYDGAVFVRHDAVLTATSGNTTTSGIYDETDGAIVAGSEVLTTSTTATLVSGSNITLTDGHSYRPTMYVSAGAGILAEGNRLVFTITNFTKFLAYVAAFTHPSTTISTSSTSYQYIGEYRPSLNVDDFSGYDVNYYYEAVLLTNNSAQTASSQLATILLGVATAISGTEVNRTGVTTTGRERSGSFTPPAGANDLAVGIKNSGATTTIRQAYVIHEVSIAGASFIPQISIM